MSWVRAGVAVGWMLLGAAQVCFAQAETGVEPGQGQGQGQGQGPEPEAEPEQGPEPEQGQEPEQGPGPEQEPEQEPDSTVAPPGTSLFEPAPAAVAPDEPARSLLEVAGYVRGDLFIGKVPGVAQPLVSAAYGELALQLDVRDADYGHAHAEARLRYGQQGDLDDLILDLREAYVDAYLGPVDLRFGQQIVVWGRADAFNPTSQITPLDFRIRSPIEDDRRLANVGARAFVDLQPVRIEGVWMPLYLPTEYPPIELDPYIVLGAPDFPVPALENGLGAARVHLELAAFELSGSYIYGYAPLPGLALRDFTVGEDPPEVRIARTAYQHHVAGFDFSTAIGDLFALRGEAAYRHPVDWEEHGYSPRPDLQWVLGVDRAFGPVNVIAQYMGRYTFDWERATGPEDPIDPETLVRFMPPLPRSLEREIVESIDAELAVRNQALFSQTARLQHLATVRIEWLSSHEDVSLSALAMVNFTTEEWLLFPKLGYRISDAIRAYAGAEIYSGPPGTLFDLIDESLTAGYAELRVGF